MSDKMEIIDAGWIDTDELTVKNSKAQWVLGYIQGMLLMAENCGLEEPIVKSLIHLESRMRDLLGET